MTLEGLEGADDKQEGHKDAGAELEVPTVILRASKIPDANSRVSKVPAMIVALLWFLPQPRQNLNIL